MAAPRKFTLIEMEAAFAERGDLDTARRIHDLIEPPPCFTDLGLRKALEIEENPDSGPLARCLTIVAPVMSEFISSSPATKARYLAYVQEQLAKGRAAGQNGSYTPPSTEDVEASSRLRTRRPVTDPEILAKRSQALVKARAARAERLAAAKAAAMLPEAEREPELAGVTG